VAALRSGRGIVTDYDHGAGWDSQAAAGKVRHCRRLLRGRRRGAREAGAQGITRSILAMRKGAAGPGNGIFVIGNAPTALFELLRLMKRRGSAPT